MDKNSLVEQLQRLASLEKDAADEIETLRTAQEAFQKTPEYYIYSANVLELDLLQTEIKKLREMIKFIVLAKAKEENFDERKPVDGIEIKQFETVTVLNEKEAKAWASANMPNALTLKTSELSKVLKGGLEVDWAKVEPEFRVQIASDLSGYLPKEE